MTLWIRLLTWSRLPLAAAITLCWAYGKFEIGAHLFALGLLTKGADTSLADRLDCPIPADDWLYRMVAVCFNAAATVGLSIGFGSMAMHGKLSWTVAALPLIITVALMGLTRLFVKPHSLTAKVRSGVVSAILALCLTPVASTMVVILCLFWIVSGEGYKLCAYKTAPTR